MRKTLQSLIGSVLVAGSLTGCSSAKYSMSQKELELIVNWGVMENVDDIMGYAKLQKMLKEGNYDEAKLFVKFKLESEGSYLKKFSEVMAIDKNLSAEEKNKVMGIMKDYVKLAEEGLNKK